MNYKRLNEIDAELVRLKRLSEDIKKGSESIDVIGLTTSSYCYITVRVKHKTIGIDWNDTAAYKVMSRYVLSIFEDQMKKLKAEKQSILNKRWFHFWK